jgi:hypothetical protein
MYNLALVSIQEDRWDKGGAKPADDEVFFRGNRNYNHNLQTDYFSYKNEPYQQLRTHAK